MPPVSRAPWVAPYRARPRATRVCCHQASRRATRPFARPTVVPSPASSAIAASPSVFRNELEHLHLPPDAVFTVFVECELGHREARLEVRPRGAGGVEPLVVEVVGDGHVRVIREPVLLR